MSETSPETQPEPTPPIPGGPVPADDAGHTEETRYGAYDDTYLKFVPGVYKSKAAARAAAKAAGVKDFTVREV